MKPRTIPDDIVEPMLKAAYQILVRQEPAIRRDWIRQQFLVWRSGAPAPSRALPRLQGLWAYFAAVENMFKQTSEPYRAPPGPASEG